MKRIERLDLIDRIGRELQSRMSYADINVYLAGFDVDTNKETSGVNSKWVYTKELLADVPDKTILKLAEELEIEHGFLAPRDVSPSDSKFWIAGHFRLFLSHLSSFKVQTARLQKALRGYGISAFVAHEDIEPTREWQDEIENALFSMDALAAILTPGFRQSEWADQEVGVAVGRDVLVVPIRKGLDPYGLIAKYQGMQGEGKTIRDVADYLFQVLSNHPKTRSRMAGALVEQILMSSEVSDATAKLGLLRRIGSLPDKHLERLRENVLENSRLAESNSFVLMVNELLKERGLGSLTREEEEVAEAFDHDIPF